jgi:hypothetical protein
MNGEGVHADGVTVLPALHIRLDWQTLANRLFEDGGRGSTSSSVVVWVRRPRLV